MKAVTFRLPEKDVELLKSYAKEHGIAQAEAIRIAIQKLDDAIHVPDVERAGDGWAQTVAALVAQILDPQPVLHPYRGHAPMFWHGRMPGASF